MPYVKTGCYDKSNAEVFGLCAGCSGTVRVRKSQRISGSLHCSKCVAYMQRRGEQMSNLNLIRKRMLKQKLRDYYLGNITEKGKDDLIAFLLHYCLDAESEQVYEEVSE